MSRGSRHDDHNNVNLHVTFDHVEVDIIMICQPPRDRSRDHRQTEVDCELCQPLLNQSEAGMLV